MILSFRAVSLIMFLSVHASAYAESPLVEFTFAYDVQEGFPSFMGQGQSIPYKMPGSYIEILQLVEQKVPIRLNLVRLPWERCKAYLKANKVDGINSSFNSLRQEIGVFPYTIKGDIDRSRRITSDTYRLFARDGSDIFYDSFSNRIINTGKGVLAPLGYSIVSDLRKRGTQIEEPSIGVKGILQMLALGRASGVIAHETQATHIIKSSPELFSNIKPIDPPIKKKDYFVLISKSFYQRHPELSEQIWDAIGELRENKLTEINDKYLSLNTE